MTFIKKASSSYMSSDTALSARRQARELRSRPWANKAVVRCETVATKPTPPSGGQLTTAGTCKDGQRLAPQSHRLPVFNGDTRANTFVRHTLADSFTSRSRLPQLASRLAEIATNCCPAAEEKQKGICAISKSSGAAGVVESSPPPIPEKDEVEIWRAVANSAVEPNG